MRIDLLAFPGHKGLMGPTGTGALYVSPRVTIKEWREGGTGGDSSNETQPKEFPYYLEGGTPNVVGVAGLVAGLQWVERLRCGLEESLAPESLSVVAGVGHTPGREATAYAAMREAIRAADIAASMGPDSPPALHFARLGALRLIFHLADNPELRAFQRDVLGALEAADAARRSEFVRTLDAFLRAGGNHMRAARDLNVHRNTLIYRLERIRTILENLSLEIASPDEARQLLALKGGDDVAF